MIIAMNEDTKSEVQKWIERDNEHLKYHSPEPEYKEKGMSFQTRTLLEIGFCLIPYIIGILSFFFW